MAPVIICAASIWMHSKFLLFSIEQLSHIMLAYWKSDLMYVVYSFNNENLSDMNLFLLSEPILFQAFSTIYAICSVHVASLLNISPKCLCLINSLICVVPMYKGGGLVCNIF